MNNTLRIHNNVHPVVSRRGIMLIQNNSSVASGQSMYTEAHDWQLAHAVLHFPLIKKGKSSVESTPLAMGTSICGLVVVE